MLFRSTVVVRLESSSNPELALRVLWSSISDAPSLSAVGALLFVAGKGCGFGANSGLASSLNFSAKLRVGVDRMDAGATFSEVFGVFGVKKGSRLLVELRPLSSSISLSFVASMGAFLLFLAFVNGVSFSAASWSLLSAFLAVSNFKSGREDFSQSFAAAS